MVSESPAGGGHRAALRRIAQGKMVSRVQGKSMFGTQPLSSRRSSAAYGFGSSTRGHANRLYFGESHAKTSVESVTPGPCYNIQGSSGRQADSGRQSMPHWKFSTTDRLKASPDARERQNSPGPGSYDHVSGFGRQELSMRSSFPRYGFGTGDREKASKVSRCPSVP